MPIKFGTDGWRAVIAEDYTFDNVRLCAQGAAMFLKNNNLAAQRIVIGYDTRFGSERFAAAVAEVTTANGVPTTLCDRAAPTPVVSYNLVAQGAGGGAVITASHNPPEWNGFKYKPHYGGSASPEVVEELERYIAEAEESGSVRRMSLRDAESQGLLDYIDPEPVYLGHIAELIDVQAIRNAGLNIVVDSMYGAGAGYFDKLLSGGSTRITELHAERNPLFPGMERPEPIGHNLNELMSAVPDTNADVGIATDGDADRLGIVDEDGRFITTLETFALLCMHQLEVLQKRGPMVRSLTMTSMIDKLGDLYGVKVFDTPVGFKFLGPVMMRENALIAGEESGGYAFQGNIPERDGILSGLMLLDMMVKTEKSIPELMDLLVSKVGPHVYDRWDLTYDAAERETILARVKNAKPPMLGGKRVEYIDERDGFRYVLEGGFWTLVRFSGTEPVLRLYAEAESTESVNTLLEEVRQMAGV